jgi:NADPH:quinone reductase-like Zn-dependent oxidoreductase
LRAESLLVLKPANVSFEEAAAVPMSAVTALQGLRDKGGIRVGQSVLINGASGGVGSFAVQIAKSFGAEVTAVCSSRNMDLARSLGADHVIDYGAEDFTKSGRRYDLILATNGYHPLSAYRRALSVAGVYVTTGGAGKQMSAALFFGPWFSLFGRQKLRNAMAKPNAKDLGFVKELLEAGKIKPAIDRRYPLAQVPEAMRYLEEGHAQGKIVITMT